MQGHAEMMKSEPNNTENLDIRTIHDVKPEDAVALLKAVMGDAFGREKSTDLWMWKHRSNPAGASLGYAAYSPGGDLIALRPFMRWRLRDETGAEVSAVRAVDTVVHPDWRRGGLFSRLTKLAIEGLAEDGVALVFNTPNDRSGPGNRKMGWQLLGHPTVWVRPRLTRALFSGSAQRASTLMGLEPFDGHGASLAGRVPLAAPSGGLMVLKDAAYLKWRYEQHPNLSYAVLEAPGASAIVREDQRGGRKGVALVDCFMEALSLQRFRGLLKAVRMQTGGAYLISGPLPKGPQRIAAISHGFLPVPWRNVNLAARPITWPPEAAVFHDRTAWHLTLGDLETF
jgi:GNAT superfamily N-acetyltransferase